MFRQTRLVSSITGFRNERKRQQYAVFQKTPIPESDRIEEWAALIEGALPPHLRNPGISPPLLTLAATDLAEVLLAAQRPNTRTSHGFDLLYHLGFDQGRWNAVVWLIKKLVDRFPMTPHPDTTTLNYLNLWNQVPPFRVPLTAGSRTQLDGDPFDHTAIDAHAAGKHEECPLQIELDDSLYSPDSIKAKSLNELTGSPGVDGVYQQDLSHAALGQIWRTLGAMTQACAGGSIRQEVLEIIAYLHHREIMPTSIYQYQPRMDKSAIQQPPLIPLLSSRILTSLSDAAWRAHEKLMVEEAKIGQPSRDSNAPPAFAAPYRARIDGIFPEVWLELILWSCLHGGWIEQGGRILEKIASRKGWRPLSWREYEKALPPTGQMNSNDWDAWDYLFKTRAPSTMDPPRSSIPEVQQTVSAEVVNAYIDAIAGLPSDRYAPKGSSFRPVQKVLQLKKFLAKQELGLTTGSWDALVVRLIESQGEVPEETSMDTGRIVDLSPGLGQGLKSKNTQDLPAYVLDGGLAMQGILNRSLYGMLASGNLERALRVFRDMVMRTDKDKQTSMASFMEGSKPLLRALHGDDMFTSNVTGIDYPAFNLQIPTTTLALLLDLVTQAREYDFGRWLLYSKDADGPVIKSDQYDDSFLIPALVRFATATQDTRLFSTLRSLPNFSVHLVLDAQIDAMRWDAATGIVQHTNEDEPKARKAPKRSWNMNSLANLVRVMLSQVPGASGGEAKSHENLQSAMTLFTTMVDQVEPGDSILADKVQTLLSVLASVDESWATFCWNLRRRYGHHDFQMNSGQFNHLLEGVVSAYGSAQGRRLLRLFWPRSVRPSYRSASKDPQNRIELHRIVVPLPGLSDTHKAVMYGALRPNVRTMVIILRKAISELRDQTADDGAVPQSSVDLVDEDDAEVVNMTQRGVVAWAARQMADLSDVYRRSDTVYNLDAALNGLEMEDLRKDVPDIVKGVEADMALRSAGWDDADESGSVAMEREEEPSESNDDVR